jgi:DNA-binding NtrC family response regulator
MMLWEDGTGDSMFHATVLIVDGEPLIRWAVGERLRAEGYEVREAATGAAAIDQFANGVDVVLLDSKLPDVNGRSVLERLLALDPTLPVVLMTADPDAANWAETLTTGGFWVANKPFLLDDLVDLVNRASTDRIGPRGRDDLRKPFVRTTSTVH